MPGRVVPASRAGSGSSRPSDVQALPVGIGPVTMMRTEGKHEGRRAQAAWDTLRRVGQQA
jgi:hypothetical protein